MWLWQNSGPCGCRTEVSISLLAVSWGCSLLLEASLPPCHMVPSISKATSGKSPFHQTPFMLHLSLTRKSPVSFND